MGTSVLHIKTEVECRVYLFDEEKGIAKPGTYFNLEVMKGEQDLLFVSTVDEAVCCLMQYNVEGNDCDCWIEIEHSRFVKYAPEVLEYIQKAKQGDADAQYQLGRCYCEGKGVDKNKGLAFVLFQKSVNQGYGEACVCLGCCLMNGYAVEKNKVEAVKWYREAAARGMIPRLKCGSPSDPAPGDDTRLSSPRAPLSSHRHSGMSAAAEKRALPVHAVF